MSPSPAAGFAGVPPAAAVEDNRWPDVAVPALGAWEPSATVSVVMPCRDGAEELRRTLAALAAQTYPATLIDVVVADDGSEPALDATTLTEGLVVPFAVTVVRQERSGFGAGRARNLGAAHARGEILLFLDADTLLEPWAVEAHARWHHAVRDAVVLGRSRNVEAQGLDPGDLAVTGPAGLAPLLEGRTVDSPTWITKFLARREQLTTRHRDLFAVLTSRNVSVRAGLFADVGGFTAYGIRGIEDTELGWRLFAAGGLFVPDAEAFGYHQGIGHLEQEQKAATKRRRTPLLHHAIPATRIRPKGARRFSVPRVLVTLDAGGQRWEEVVAAVDAVLAGRVRDVGVHLEGVAGHDDEVLLRETFAPDARVSGLDGETPPRFCEVTVTTPTTTCFGHETVARLLTTLERRRVGRVVVRLPDETGQVTATLTRAAERARRVAADRGSDDIDGVVAELFGDWWLAAGQADLDGADEESPAEAMTLPALRAIEAAQRDATAHRKAAKKAEHRAERAERRREELEAQLAAVRNRKVVRFADAAGDRLRIRRRR